MEQCYNRGCGQLFDPAKNNDDSCCHHPGVPFFHDAYKGWSCCKKKSVDFTEFLNFKGCTLSKHSNIKPPEPEKPAKKENDDKDEVIEVRQPIRMAMERPPITTPMTLIKTEVEDSVRQAIDALKTKQSTGGTDVSNDGEITVGTACKNSGCTFSYTGTPADKGECQYHSGVPIFHEGMKYWSCCKKKTSDFAVFMAQKGCCYGHHKWIKEDNNKREVECRYDWHQTATNVIVSIYAKKCHYKKSKIEVSPVRLHANLVFPEQDDATFDLDMELRGVIDVAQTTARMFSTKVEITMRKAEPGSWPKLEFPQKPSALPKAAPAQTSTNKTCTRSKKDSGSEDDFNLDDIETLKPGGLTISDITDNKNHLD